MLSTELSMELLPSLLITAEEESTRLSDQLNKSWKTWLLSSPRSSWSFKFLLLTSKKASTPLSLCAISPLLLMVYTNTSTTTTGINTSSLDPELEDIWHLNSGLRRTVSKKVLLEIWATTSVYALVTSSLPSLMSSYDHSEIYFKTHYMPVKGFWGFGVLGF